MKLKMTLIKLQNEMKHQRKILKIKNKQIFICF